MNKLLLIAALAVAGYLVLAPAPGTSDGTGAAAQAGVSAYAGEGNDAAIDHAIANHSKQQLEGKGTVERLLADDNHGSRHQRFIVRLDSGRTLLVAHNIDLAPRIDSLHAGDAVAFFGEYEWNPKGGVIHWTHRDPQGRHVAGWIRHGGRIYQ